MSSGVLPTTVMPLSSFVPCSQYEDPSLSIFLLAMYLIQSPLRVELDIAFIPTFAMVWHTSPKQRRIVKGSKCSESYCGATLHQFPHPLSGPSSFSSSAKPLSNFQAIIRPHCLQQSIR